MQDVVDVLGDVLGTGIALVEWACLVEVLMVQLPEHLVEARAKFLEVESDTDRVQLRRADHRGYAEVMAVQSLARVAVPAQCVRGGEPAFYFNFVRHSYSNNELFGRGLAGFGHGR